MNDLYSFRTEYIVIPVKSNTNLVDEYTKFIHDADALKKATNGLINLYKTGSIKNTAMHLFDKLSKTIENPEPIRPDEARWIERATTGAVIWNEKYEGEAYEYDIKSQYPSLLRSQLILPTKRGEFKRETSEWFGNLKFFPTGIYRVKITAGTPEVESVSKQLFRFSFDNYYTHISLTHARQLGLTLELICDGVEDEPNILLYPRSSCCTCVEAFGKYVDLLFPLKVAGVPLSKDLLNTLWGALSEILSKTKLVDSKDDALMTFIPDDCTIRTMYPYQKDDEQVLFEVVSDLKYYKTNFARIAPFLLSKGRVMIADIVYPHREFVKRIHTDGFLSTVKLEKVKTGSELGNLEYKGYCPHLEIKSNARPKGEFTLSENQPLPTSV